MRTPAAASTRVSAALLAFALVAGCSEASLRNAPDAPVPPLDNKLSISGRFCAQTPTPEEFPVRILFLVDVSQSMNVTDPAPLVCDPTACFTRRGQAVDEVVTKYPPGNGIAYGLITFSSEPSVLTADDKGLGGFTLQRDSVRTKLPFLNKGFGESNFEGALEKAYETLQTDMIALDATARSRARYVVVFVSDGLPAPRTDTSGLPEGIRDKIRDIKQLERQQRLAEIKLHTVFLGGTNTPGAVQLTAKELMAQMAREGGGSFRSFDATDQLNLLYIDFTSFVRSFALKRLVVANLNARARGNASDTDSDGDGLLDVEEMIPGTDPTRADTDGDGFSDLLEVRLASSGFDPRFPGDADCTLDEDRRDDDGDGLRNCEERFVGTSLRLVDSDADGYSDDAELRLGSNPVASDALVDTDFDGARNGVEVAAHTDPTANDAADFSKLAYRYDIKEVPREQSMPGRACYDFTVDNVALAPTAASGDLPAGTNTILIKMAAAPQDGPEDYGNHQIACVRARYSLVPEIKQPPSGKVRLDLTAFKKPAGPADDPEVFHAERDCIRP